MCDQSIRILINGADFFTERKIFQHIGIVYNLVDVAQVRMEFQNFWILNLSLQRLDESGRMRHEEGATIKITDFWSDWRGDLKRVMCVHDDSVNFRKMGFPGFPILAIQDGIEKG